jgi:CO/xanthine dehydrogenase Mo-binding subunit
VRGHINGNIGAYIRSNATIAPRNVAQCFSGPYRIPNIHIEASMVVTNKTPPPGRIVVQGASRLTFSVSVFLTSRR